VIGLVTISSFHFPFAILHFRLSLSEIIIPAMANENVIWQMENASFRINAS
jgi:hypothetical protein